MKRKWLNDLLDWGSFSLEGTGIYKIERVLPERLMIYQLSKKNNDEWETAGYARMPDDIFADKIVFNMYGKMDRTVTTEVVYNKVEALKGANATKA